MEKATNSQSSQPVKKQQTKQNSHKNSFKCSIKMTVEYQKIDIKRKQEKREWLTVAVPQSRCHSSVLVDAPLGWYCRLECSLQSYHWSEYAQTLKQTKKLSQYWFGVRSMDRLQGEIFPQPACLWKVEGALWGAITIPLNSSPHKHFGTNGLQV